MSKKRASQKGSEASQFDEQRALLGKVPRPGLPRRQPPEPSRFQHWPNAPLREQLETKEQKLAELKQTHPDWRLWGPGQAGPAELAARLEHDIQDIKLQLIPRTTKRTPIANPKLGRAQAKPEAVKLAAQLARGEWIEKQLEAGALVCELLHAGKSPEDVSNQFPEFFKDVIDALPDYKRQQFFRDAKRHKMRQPELARYIAEAKGWESGGYVLNLRKKYRASIRQAKPRIP